MNRISKFQENRQDCVLSLDQTKSTKGGLREFLKIGTGNPVNHARYRLACRCAQNIMYVELADGPHFCIDW